MKFKFILLLLLVSNGQLFAQKIIAFDKSGKIKRVRYYQGELIKLRKKSGQLIFGTIEKIEDSSFVVNGNNVTIDSVSKIYNTQKLAGFKFFSQFFLLGGAAYFPLVTVNRAINKDDPTFSKQAAIISGSLLATGIIFSAIANRAYRISAKRPLKIIDVSP